MLSKIVELLDKPSIGVLGSDLLAKTTST